jgi:hypothetical protein
VSAVLTATSVKTALTLKYRQVLSQLNVTDYSVTAKSSYENVKTKNRIFEKCSRLKRKKNTVALNVRNLTQCPDPVQCGTSALHARNGPATFASDSAISMFAATATLKTTLTISRL